MTKSHQPQPNFFGCYAKVFRKIPIYAFWISLFVFLDPLFDSTLFANDDLHPNILWLSTEDIGPEIGCYGHPDAVTPTLDAWAQKSMVYDYAWSNYPVCAPARTTIIAGMYASANGAGNMRSGVKLPDGVELFPTYLRKAGYYCTNNEKTDYNYRKLEPIWDESSRQAHYRNRPAGKPFFAVFNHTGTHESKIRVRPHKKVIDPASVHLKSYWPDIPEVREDWAQYHDNITRMDGWVKGHLQQLEEAGLSDNTIVIFFGDHGSGMPRHKRFAGDSGQRVPFIVHVPEKWKQQAGTDYQPGKHVSRPVGFVDLAPTMLSIAGIQPPSFMQGHAFLGDYQTEAPKYLYGFRDRMDERPDISRAIRDQKFIYVRNYMPHLPPGQYVEYQHVTPTTRKWFQLFEQGKLSPVQAQFWQPHPAEELYDLEHDPEETKNLIQDPAFRSVADRFRAEHRKATIRFHDLGLIPEAILYEAGKQGTVPRTKVLDDPVNFPLEKIFEVANGATSGTQESINIIKNALVSELAVIRYWGTVGVLVNGKEGFDQFEKSLDRLVADDNPTVSIVAAESLATYGNEEQKESGIKRLTKFANARASNFYNAILALNAIDRIGVEFSLIEELRALPEPDRIPRGGNYVQRLLDDLDRADYPNGKPKAKKQNKKPKNKNGTKNKNAEKRKKGLH